MANFGTSKFEEAALLVLFGKTVKDIQLMPDGQPIYTFAEIGENIKKQFKQFEENSLDVDAKAFLEAIVDLTEQTNAKLGVAQPNN